MIDFTDIELFKDFIIIQFNDKIYDLHSDYECKILEFSGTENKLTLRFHRKEGRNSTSEQVSIEFSEARLSNFALFFPSTQDSATLNIIYRGRFEKHGQLHEYSEKGERYFYFEFETGNKFEVYSTRVVFNTDI